MNLWSGDSSHSSPLRVVAAAEIASVALLFVSFAIIRAAIFGLWVVLVSLAAYLAALHYRSPTYNKKGDIIWSIVLLVMAAGGVGTTIAVASQLGLTGS